MDTFKSNLNRLFRNLRKRGMIARQNFKCCQSCGWGYMAGLANKSKKAPTGLVFYHKQDAEDLLANPPFVYLAHSGKNAANVVVEEARKLEIAIEWDGTSTQRILLKG